MNRYPVFIALSLAVVTAAFSVSLGGCARGTAVRNTPSAELPSVITNGVPDVRFGSSAAIAASGSLIVAGAPGLYRDTNYAGAVYAMTRTGGVWQRTALPLPAGTSYSYLGASVAVSGDGNVAAAGAPFSTNANGIDCGAAFVFERTNGNWTASKLDPVDGGPGDWFGMSVAVSADGSTVAVGSPSDNFHGWAAGSVTVYRKQDGVWKPLSVLHTADPNTLDFFGISVALSADGSTVAAGAYLDDEKCEDCGAAYVFRYNGSNWTQKKIKPSAADLKQGFGISVSLSGDGSILAVGARTANAQYTDAGAVYVYRLQGNNASETRLLASDRAKGEMLGYSVSVSEDGNVIAAGAIGDSVRANRAGAVYGFRWTGAGWGETKFYAPDAAHDDAFGACVSVTRGGEYVIAGAPVKDESSGTVYVLPFSGGVPARVEYAPQQNAQVQPDAWNPIAVTASDAQAGAFFGLQTALSYGGTRMLAGAGRDNGAGAVYLYDFDKASQLWKENKWTARGATNGQLFGYSVALSGNGGTALVGAVGDPAHGAMSGAAYLYRQAGGAWRVKKLVPHDATNGQLFGNSAALSQNGRVAAVGAFRSRHGGDANAGAVYVYARKLFGWSETKIVASDVQAQDQFGGSVSLSADGKVLAVGATGDDDKAYNSGAVYVYRFDGNKWVETKLVSPGASPDGGFGSTVALSPDGNTLAVAALGEDAGGRDSGVVYVFRFDGTKWTASRVLPSDVKAGQGFGSGVSLSRDGTMLVAGSAMDKTRGDSAGAVYVFRWDASAAKWNERKLTADDGLAGDVFGISVDVSADGKIFCAGAYGRGNRAGAVEVFSRE